jgi:hypothetical protein
MGTSGDTMQLNYICAAAGAAAAADSVAAAVVVALPPLQMHNLDPILEYIFQIAASQRKYELHRHTSATIAANAVCTCHPNSSSLVKESNILL